MSIRMFISCHLLLGIIVIIQTMDNLNYYGKKSFCKLIKYKTEKIYEIKNGTEYSIEYF